MTAFYTEYQELTFDKVSFEVHTKYIENNGTRIDDASAAAWGFNKKTKEPSHWSGDKMGLQKQARLLEPVMKLPASRRRGGA